MFQSVNSDGIIPGLCLSLAVWTANIDLFAVFQKLSSLVYDWMGAMDSEAGITGIEMPFYFV